MRPFPILFHFTVTLFMTLYTCWILLSCIRPPTPLAVFQTHKRFCSWQLQFFSLHYTFFISMTHPTDILTFTQMALCSPAPCEFVLLHKYPPTILFKARISKLLLGTWGWCWWSPPFYVVVWRRIVSWVLMVLWLICRWQGDFSLVFSRNIFSCCWAKHQWS